MSDTTIQNKIAIYDPKHKTLLKRVRQPYDFEHLLRPQDTDNAWRAFELISRPGMSVYLYGEALNAVIDKRLHGYWNIQFMATGSTENVQETRDFIVRMADAQKTRNLLSMTALSASPYR